MTRRRGYSLVEMIVVLTLISVALSSIALVLHSLHRAERRLRDDGDFARTVQRLETQLRADAHAARGGGQIAFGNAPSALTLLMPGEQTVTYTIEPGGVERLVRQGEATKHREWFALAGASLAWSSNSTGPQEYVATLILEASNDRMRADQLAAKIIRIDAAVSPAWPARSNSGENK